MKTVLRWMCLFGVSLAFLSVARAEAPMPRTIYALYDGNETQDIRTTNIHQFAEMPLNHLGYRLSYYDVNEPLPAYDDSIAAVMLWFVSGTEVENPEALLTWLEDALRQNKKLIVFGSLAVGEKYREKPEGLKRIRGILRQIGVEDEDKWSNITYKATIDYNDKTMTQLERQFGGSFPPYLHTVAYGKDAVSHLKLKNFDTEGSSFINDLIITHPNGGYVSQHYVKFEVFDDKDEGSKMRQWYINPFAFFKKVLESDRLPKPDVTTLYGRRIFYSHMDGDGWNSLTEIEGYNERKTIAADVLRQEIFDYYDDLPFSVSIIVSELELGCYGVPESIPVAKRIFELPNVEPTSHTHSHPLYWGFFADGNTAKEKPFLPYYPKRPVLAKSIYSAFFGWVGTEENEWDKKDHARPAEHIHRAADYVSDEEYLKNVEAGRLANMYETPRSYACSPLDIHEEIKGSVDYVRALAPPDKEVKLLQWSGNTRPFEEAIKIARENNILNINGGDTRLDREYPSYSYVAPIGAQVGNERQIYSSNSNENTYTNLWTDRFFGFQFLTRTVLNTETPIRLTPFNVYFHTYSGTKKPSLEAVKVNLEFAKTQNIIPVFTSEYAQIANDFYDVELVPLSETSWRIEGRKTLQTIRFDHATLKTVDWERSEGVLGQSYLHGSLYVALDPDVDQPVIAINMRNTIDFPVKSSRPYVIKSRWKIKGLQYFNNLLTFTAEGFGSGAMEWYWPGTRAVTVRIEKDNQILSETTVPVEADGTLRFDPDTDATVPLKVTILPQNVSES